MMIFKPISTVVAAILLSSCNNEQDKRAASRIEVAEAQDASGQENENPVAMDVVKFIESRISLPDGAYELNRYDRYYNLGDETFEAIYIRAEGKEGEVKFYRQVAEVPALLDGGCIQLNVQGSVSKPESARVFCNGLS